MVAKLVLFYCSAALVIVNGPWVSGTFVGKPLQQSHGQVRMHSPNARTSFSAFTSSAFPPSRHILGPQTAVLPNQRKARVKSNAFVVHGSAEKESFIRSTSAPLRHGESSEWKNQMNRLQKQVNDLSHLVKQYDALLQSESPHNFPQHLHHLEEMRHRIHATWENVTQLHSEVKEMTRLTSVASSSSLSSKIRSQLHSMNLSAVAAYIKQHVNKVKEGAKFIELYEEFVDNVVNRPVKKMVYEQQRRFATSLAHMEAYLTHAYSDLPATHRMEFLASKECFHRALDDWWLISVQRSGKDLQAWERKAVHSVQAMEVWLDVHPSTAHVPRDVCNQVQLAMTHWKTSMDLLITLCTQRYHFDLRDPAVYRIPRQTQADLCVGLLDYREVFQSKYDALQAQWHRHLPREKN